MKLIYFGSGAFGLPTLRTLAKRHDVRLVVTQPDRAAGRARKSKPTPIAAWAEKNAIETIKPKSVNESETIQRIHDAEADAYVVIAYGQKLSQRLLSNQFAINLHASLLPKYRGAAPINWAIINGERTTGLSVIALADRMDAGDIFGQVETAIDPHETAGELHDRLAERGPQLVLDVLERFQRGEATSEPQDEAGVAFAPKLSKGDGTVSFDQPAEHVRDRVHGLTPWPGCRVMLGESTLRLHRVAVETESVEAPPGTILFGGGRVACSEGAIRLLAVHPPGGKLMSFEAFSRGHSIETGAILTPIKPERSES